MSTDLQSIGFGTSDWRETIEAAIATYRLSVIGEVRDGQLVRYDDPSGAQLYILGVEPFSTYTGFASSSTITGHVSPVDDVLSVVDITDDVPSSPNFEKTVCSLTAHIAQGPMIVEAGTQSFEQVALTGLALDITTDASADAYAERTGNRPGTFNPVGAAPVLRAGGGVPNACAVISATVSSVDRRANALTGENFYHATITAGPVPMDFCVSTDDVPTLEPGMVVSGTVQMVGEIIPPAGCGDGCGCGSGGCGCG
ncbi:hypothetical protein KRX51_05040 [Corynebacterium sp. TAE3-ERU12]|uniref:hypothetical protein n=1 Tax=Corynebacterium sp. TAE3-ERU12 TaxID=2849491 RepID=UPI001C484998|nr:hypothetical protein [Corynebacterium sp. TAE3-ERU12]MBV7295285.1 hypothetical protein [Corynebacterium sp. TAE3-ERU12]